jgi:cell division protein FtsQ
MAPSTVTGRGAHAARLPARRRASTRRGRARGGRRARPRSGRSRVRVWIRRLIAAGIVGGLLVAGYVLWLRDASVFAIDDVRVEGISSAEGDEVTAALTRAARGMTVLHVREDELRAVASRYPTVETVSTARSFPDGLTIHVTERTPVAVVEGGGRDLPVAGDGTLLPGVSTEDLDLPTIAADPEPSATRLADQALDQARVLGGAPGPMLALVAESAVGEEGIVLELANGITLVFGDAAQTRAKWTAASRVLADAKLGALSYVDVRAPDRPAVGGATEVPGSA